jgi:hypothetical protein
MRSQDQAIDAAAHWRMDDETRQRDHILTIASAPPAPASALTAAAVTWCKSAGA